MNLYTDEELKENLGYFVSNEFDKMFIPLRVLRNYFKKDFPKYANNSIAKARRELVKKNPSLKEKRNEYCREYYQKNKEKIKAYQKEYNRKNAERIKECRRNNYLKLKQNQERLEKKRKYEREYHRKLKIRDI